MAGHAVCSPQHQCGEGKHTARARKVKLLLKATENETEFYQKEELEENSNYSFKPIEDVKLRSTEKKNSNGVSESKILVDATIPFQSFGDMRKCRTETRRSI